MNQGDNAPTDERHSLIDASFVDGFDVEDDEDRWMSPYDGVMHKRIHRTRTNQLRRR